MTMIIATIGIGGLAFAGIVDKPYKRLIGFIVAVVFLGWVATSIYHANIPFIPVLN